MGKKMRRPETTAADLPDEIVRGNILTRLPIKSVVRLKIISKSWLSLFSNPQFVKEHRTHHSTQNPNDYDCLIADKRFKLVMLTRYKETLLLPFDNNEDYFLIGSINGLVCIRFGLKLFLWNPAIHQFKEFTIPVPLSGVYETMGLGFDSLSDTFKVVVLLNDMSSAAVYCSGSDSWSDVSIPDSVFPVDKFEEMTQTVIVKGFPYWTFSGYDDDDEVWFSVVKFDVNTCKFKSSPALQFDGDAYGSEGYSFWHQFVEMKDRLSLILYDTKWESCVLEIYSLDGDDVEASVWSKMYTIGPLNFYYHGLGRYASLSLSQGFKYGDEIVFHEYGMFSCISFPCTDHIEDTTKSLHGTTSTYNEISCFRYEPTLFFIQGMKSVHLDTQSRTVGGYRAPRQLISSLRV